MAELWIGTGEDMSIFIFVCSGIFLTTTCFRPLLFSILKPPDEPPLGNMDSVVKHGHCCYVCSVADPDPDP